MGKWGEGEDHHQGLLIPMPDSSYHKENSSPLSQENSVYGHIQRTHKNTAKLYVSYPNWNFKK